jgi:hypothetical protein
MPTNYLIAPKTVNSAGIIGVGFAQQSGRCRIKPDIECEAGPAGLVAIDPLLPLTSRLMSGSSGCYTPAATRSVREQTMKTEHQKMLAGEPYDPMDANLVVARAHARDLCQALNVTRETEEQERRKILNELFGAGGDTVWMQPPFFCDYGSNIELGERVFFNFNCVVLDVCPVIVGSFTLFGPAVQIYTPMHPLNAELRRREEFGSRYRLDRTFGSAARQSFSPACGSVRER